MRRCQSRLYNLLLLLFIARVAFGFSMWRGSRSVIRRLPARRLPKRKTFESPRSWLWRSSHDFSFRRDVRLLSSAAPVSQAPLSYEEDDDEDRVCLEETAQLHSSGDAEIEEYLSDRGIQSRPVEGGGWNPRDPLGWTRDFGRRSAEEDERLQQLARLGPGDEGYFDSGHIKIPGVTIVRTKEQAQRVLERLYAAGPEVFHACDTEVMEIDLKKVGPVGNGYVTCLSMYSGYDFDYGDGPGTCLWIDNLDEAAGILQEFKDWLEDERFLKVWHNYGFDRHALWNEGINVKGFGGDTMHMARLQDTSRTVTGRGGFSLEALSADLVGRRKRPMKEVFGVKRIRKDGTEGLLADIPPVQVLQRDPRFRAKWLEYSCYDAQGTWVVRDKLQKLLEEMEWYRDESLWHYYWRHMRPFGEVLTDMERRGVRVNAREYLAGVEKQARLDKEYNSRVFREWAATKIGADGLALNPGSAAQLQTFLFGGAANQKTKEPTETVRAFKVLREEIPEDALAAYEARDKMQKENAEGMSGAVNVDEATAWGGNVTNTLYQMRRKNWTKMISWIK